MVWKFIWNKTRGGGEGGVQKRQNWQDVVLWTTPNSKKKHGSTKPISPNTYAALFFSQVHFFLYFSLGFLSLFSKYSKCNVSNVSKKRNWVASDFVLFLFCLSVLTKPELLGAFPMSDWKTKVNDILFVLSIC